MIDPRHPLYDLALVTLSLPAQPKELSAKPPPVPVQQVARPKPSDRMADGRSEPCA